MERELGPDNDHSRLYCGNSEEMGSAEHNFHVALYKRRAEYLFQRSRHSCFHYGSGELPRFQRDAHWLNISSELHFKADLQQHVLRRPHISVCMGIYSGRLPNHHGAIHRSQHRHRFHRPCRHRSWRLREPFVLQNVQQSDRRDFPHAIYQCRFKCISTDYSCIIITIEYKSWGIVRCLQSQNILSSIGW
jgi:hypothetical protein